MQKLINKSLICFLPSSPLMKVKKNWKNAFLFLEKEWCK